MTDKQTARQKDNCTGHLKSNHIREEFKKRNMSFYAHFVDKGEGGSAEVDKREGGGPVVKKLPVEYQKVIREILYCSRSEAFQYICNFTLF